MDRIRKIFKWLVGAFIVLVFLDVFLVAGFAVFSSQAQKADAIIVMGAAINSPVLYNRSLEALRLYEEEFAPIVVLSGGRISDKDISEAEYMQKVIIGNQSKNSHPLLASPIKGEEGEWNLILDEGSGNTFENIKNSKALLPDAKSVIIVTDKYHLARSVITAKALGFEDVFWSAPKAKYTSRELRYHYAREVMALMAYLPKFVLK